MPHSTHIFIPSLPQVCKRPSCNNIPNWETGDWSDCSVACGLGTRSRRVTCMAAGSNIPHMHCSDKRPSDQEMCDMGSCATKTWFFSPWDDSCSTGCGTGHERVRKIATLIETLQTQVFKKLIFKLEWVQLLYPLPNFLLPEGNVHFFLIYTTRNYIFKFCTAWVLVCKLNYDDER